MLRIVTGETFFLRMWRLLTRFIGMADFLAVILPSLRDLVTRNLVPALKRRAILAASLRDGRRPVGERCPSSVALSRSQGGKMLAV